MKRSYVISLLLALCALAWIGSGQFGSAENSEPRKPPADLSPNHETAKVRVRSQEAEPRAISILLQGFTDAERVVDIKAEARGRIVEAPIEKGSRVNQGEVIARIAEEDRPARLKEAKALLQQRLIEYDAASKLAQKGFRSETNLAAAKAAVDAASAEVEKAEVELANLVVRAPFAGVLDDRMMEIGDYAAIGDPVARLVDLDPILAVGYASQQDIARLKVGDEGTARFPNGEKVSGRIRFISAVADPQTRTFRLELELPNPQSQIPDGLSTELVLPTAKIAAHRVSPAILSLTEDGRVGVKVLAADNQVEFVPVQIIDEDAEGIWLAGLPERVTLITVGQDYVSIGQSVLAIDEETLEPVQQGALE